MRKLYIAAFMLFSFGALATTPDMSIVQPKPHGLTIKFGGHTVSAETFKAEGSSNYKGRNINVVDSKEAAISKKSKVLSKSVVNKRNTNLSAQVENLESTMGEIVQKFEDDRIKVAKGHEGKFGDNKVLLSDTYDIIAGINIDNLGKEQDPSVMNAFKCEKYTSEDPEDCDATKKDKHDIKACDFDERLRWTGEKWECIGVFASPSNVSCNAYQWQVKGNPITCRDYIYQWKELPDATGNWKACVDGFKEKLFECIRHKANKDSGTKVENKYCPGPMPKVIKACSS